MGISPRKNLRNKRRLILFLLRKNQEGTEIKLNIFKFMRDVQEMSDNSGPECRLVPIIATIQKSSSSWRLEGKQIYKIFKMNSDNLKFPLFDRRQQPFQLINSKLSLLSTNETRNRGFTHRYQFSVISKLTIKEDWSMKYVTEDLCKFRGVNASTGEKLFFQVDNG